MDGSRRDTSGRVKKEMNFAVAEEEVEEEWEKRAGFIKGDIPRYSHPTGNRVIAMVTLVLRTVPKKNTLN